MRRLGCGASNILDALTDRWWYRLVCLWLVGFHVDDHWHELFHCLVQVVSCFTGCFMWLYSSFTGVQIVFAIFGCADNFWPSLNGYVFDVTRPRGGIRCNPKRFLFGDGGNSASESWNCFVHYSYAHDPNIQFLFLNVHTVTYIVLPAVYIKVCKSCRTEKTRGRFWDNHSLIIVANEIFPQTRSMSLHCSHPGTKSADLF